MPPGNFGVMLHHYQMSNKTVFFCFEVFEAVGYKNLSIESLFYKRSVIFVVKALLSAGVYQRYKFNKIGKTNK